MNLTTESETAGLTRRYPGVRAFRDQPEDQALFFGRKPEIEQLSLRIFSVSLLVQFARSGLGKTSLLQAGLFPLLRQKPFLPVLVRLNKEEPLVSSVTKAMEHACLAEYLEFMANDTSGLWELLSSAVIWRDDLLLTPVLVFDQFEEVFTLRSKNFRGELAQELAALASGNPPERLRTARTDTRQDLASRTKTHVPKVKIIVSLREEYLGALEEFSLAIPQLFAERLRLGPISERGALEAINEPAHKPSGAEGTFYCSPPFEFEPQALESIIAFLKGKSGVIEPFQLQLLCQHAEDVVVDKSKSQALGGPVRLTLADLGGTEGLSSVLERFYKNTISKLPKSQRSKARRLCEEGLLDDRGHRLMLVKEKIHSDYRLSVQALEILTHDRLLVREPRLDSIFYEISHDRLAGSIQRAQPFRLPRKISRLLVTGVVITLAVFAVLAYGWYETNQERIRAEKLLNFMLGERLQAEMRDVGRGDILELVHRKSEESLKGTSFNNGLALRNRGNLHRSRGDIDQAIRDFLQAEAMFEGLVRTEGDKASVELARTLIFAGDALSDSGRVSETLKAYERAVQIRRDIADRYHEGIPGELLETYAWNSTPALELADAISSLGSLYSRTGAISEALKYYNEAISIALDHLFETTKSAKERGDPDELESTTTNPIAMSVLASAEINRAIMEGKHLDTGLFLVRESLRLRPLSAAPHLAESQTLFWRATTKSRVDIADLKKVSEGLEMLRRVDSDNALWQREWAVTQGVISNHVLQNCAQSEQSVCEDKDFVMMEAERQILESVKQLRALVSKDESNMSWKSDLAQMLIWRSNFLKDKNQSHRRMQALTEAVHYYQSMRDVNDVDGKFFLALAHRERAAAWKDQGDVKKALEDLQQERVIFEGLINQLPDHPYFRGWVVSILDEEIELRAKSRDQSVVASLKQQKAELIKASNLVRKSRDVGDDYSNPHWTQQMEVANKAKIQNNSEAVIVAYRVGIETLLKDAKANPKRAGIWSMLAEAQQELAQALAKSMRLTESIETLRQAFHSARTAVEISPQNARYQNLLSLAHIDLGDALQAKGDLEPARDQFYDSLAALGAALRLNPTEPVYHANAREVYTRIYRADNELLTRNPESQERFVKERAWALRERLYAAWRAKAFSTEQSRDEHNEPLLMAKRDLGKFLTFDKQNLKQALPLMERALLDAEKTVAGNPQNPTYHCRLGEVDYAIGFLRREQSLQGWEESIRKGLLAIDWGIRISEGDKSQCFSFSGAYRKNLGKYLIQDNRREEGQRELEMALLASQEALKFWPDDVGIKRDIAEERDLLK